MYIRWSVYQRFLHRTAYEESHAKISLSFQLAAVDSQKLFQVASHTTVFPDQAQLALVITRLSRSHLNRFLHVARLWLLRCWSDTASGDRRSLFALDAASSCTFCAWLASCCPYFISFKSTFMSLAIVTFSNEPSSSEAGSSYLVQAKQGRRT